MELNLTLGHLAGWGIMSYISASFCTGFTLFRVIAFLGLWQLLTPVQPILIDLLAMFTTMAGAELLYRVATRVLAQR